MAAPPPVRDAATVILLRDGAAGVEVFLLRRVVGMAFAGGMTVFPGGGVDTRDEAVEIGWSGPPPAAWTGPLGADEGLARAIVCAAVRETFEEAGVLLAGPDGHPVSVVDGPEWAADRAALEAREFALAAMLARRGLVLRADLLRPWAHWVTPAGEPRRYDTRFLVAALPAGQSTVESTGEADAVSWARPADALADAAAGRIGLMPPTRVMLEELLPYPTVADVLAAADGRVISRVEPRLIRLGEGAFEVELPDGRRLPVNYPGLA